MENELDLSEEWITRLHQSIDSKLDFPDFLRALNNPQSHPLFSHQENWNFREVDNSFKLYCDTNNVHFSTAVLRSSLVSMVLLTQGLPVGHLARGKMRDVYAALIKSLENPGLLLDAAFRIESTSQQGAALLNFAQSIFGRLKSKDGYHYVDSGTFLMVVSSTEMRIAFRPSQLTKRRSDKLYEQLLEVVSTDRVFVDCELTDALDCVEFVLWNQLPQLIQRIEKSPLPVGIYEANPLLSSPDIVKKVQRRYEVSQDAAVYYLQVLTLPDPTDQNVMLWNSWTAAKIETVGNELVAKNHLIQATSRDAGRKYFLPSDWVPATAPDLPIESWKMQHLFLDLDSDRHISPRFRRILALDPLHLLFKETWYRKVMDEVGDESEGDLKTTRSTSGSESPS